MLVNIPVTKVFLISVFFDETVFVFNDRRFLFVIIILPFVGAFV